MKFVQVLDGAVVMDFAEEDWWTVINALRYSLKRSSHKNKHSRLLADNVYPKVSYLIDWLIVNHSELVPVADKMITAEAAARAGAAGPAYRQLITRIDGAEAPTVRIALATDASDLMSAALAHFAARTPPIWEVVIQRPLKTAVTHVADPRSYRRIKTHESAIPSRVFLAIRRRTSRRAALAATNYLPLNTMPIYTAKSSKWPKQLLSVVRKISRKSK